MHIIKNSHSGNSSFHFGTNRNLTIIQDKYYWNNMIESVKNYIGDCSCQLAIGGNKKTITRQQIISSKPNERYQIDISGLHAKVKASSGFKYIINCIDHFSKKGFSKLIQNKNAETCYSFILSCIITLGLPEIIQTDSGGDLSIRKWSLFWKLKKLNLFMEGRTIHNHKVPSEI
jgi:hypothetical protein